MDGLCIIKSLLLAGLFVFGSKRGFRVRSFGTGTNVKLPGPSADKPNVYEFGKTTYEEMYAELEELDKQLYTSNGILSMLDRNRAIKLRPERFQDEVEQFDVIITCETRVYEQVLQAFEDRGTEANIPVHICNLDIKDNHESATLGAFDIVELCGQLEQTDDLEGEIETIIETFEAARKQAVLHTMAFY